MSTSDFLALRSFLGESDFLELEKFVKEVYKIKLELQCLFEEKNVITREYEIQKSMFYAAKDLFSNLDKDADVYDLDELRKRAGEAQRAMVSRYDFTLKKKREVVRIRENASMLRDDLKKLIKESTQEEEKSVEILLLYLQIVKDLQI